MKLNRRQFNKLSLAAVTVSRLASANSVCHCEDVDSINSLIGASTSKALGEGKTFPGPCAPFGMVQLGPDTITGGDNAPGYSYEHATIEGFSFMRMSGVGWFGDFGNLLVMPTTGLFKAASGRPQNPGEGWRSKFDHKSEVVQCGYYAVTLDDYGIRAELTSTPRAGIMRYTFRTSEQPRILVDLARRIGGTSTRQHVTKVDDHSIEGWMRCTEQGGGWGNGAGHVNYTVFFRMEFSKPFGRHGVWSVDVPATELKAVPDLLVDYFQTDAYYGHVHDVKVMEGVDTQEGEHIGLYAEFPAIKNQTILLKAGLSFVDIDGARRNLQEEIGGWGFEAVRDKNRQLWNNAVGKIKIRGATEKQRMIFNTALYHAMIDPRKIADCDHRYRAVDDKIRVEKGFANRTIFSGWDVFRTEFPLMTIIDPSVVNDMICTLIEMAQLSGRGYLERWEIMGAYSGCMDGDPALSIIADAYAKGIRNFDREAAFAACRQTANGTSGRTNRPHNDFYRLHGYVPDQISWTLDNAHFDWCVGRFAKDLGKHEDAAFFLAQSRNYKKIYDPNLKSMRARNSNGEPLPWEGELAFGQGCTESNPLQQSWFVPHDVYGLIALMGENAFSDKLEALFAQTPPNFGWNAYYNHSNEPVHHIAYLFTYVGKPWLTQKWVRKILNGAYGAGVDGICGNDDVGQMAAWFVMSALGFYPVCPGSNVYVLGSPLFKEATIALDSGWHIGKSFQVLAPNNSESNIYVQGVRLNGKPLIRSWITHQEVTTGGTLEFEMGPAPNTAWASSKETRPPDTMIYEGSA